MTPFEQIDHALALYVNQSAGQSRAFDRFVFNVVDSRLFSGGVFLVPYWWLWFKADGSGAYVQRRNIAVAALAVGVVAGTVLLLKGLLPFRRNPMSTPSLGLHLPFGVDPAWVNYTNSFPSGHAALFFALSVPLWMYSRRLGATAAAWALAVICLPLVYLGYHWPSDIAAGAVVGIVLMLLLCRPIGATGLPDRLVHFSETHAPTFYALGWLVAFETAVMFDDVKAFSVHAVRLARVLLP
ncbi:MAG: phosphatase PAP2 family protein [Proteobacteria bacterium]|nr:phosphatase PAP2 family protein [Pseudomonadota bacterium]